jgi:hypothetical protein
MSRFYLIQIGDIVLSSNGTDAENPCKLDVAGVEDLLTTVAGNVIMSASGVPVFQTIPWTVGKQFDILIQTHLYADQWNDLKELLIDSLENDTSFVVTGEGDVGDFTVTAKAFPQKPFSASGFENERIKKPIFRLITV